MYVSFRHKTAYYHCCSDCRPDWCSSDLLLGTSTCGRSAVVAFREQGSGGLLILVGSPAGQRASFGQTAYSASKGAVVAMARTWAVECKKLDVTVNAIVPTALTRMVATMPGMTEMAAMLDRGESLPPKARRSGLGSPDHYRTEDRRGGQECVSQ